MLLDLSCSLFVDLQIDLHCFALLEHTFRSLIHPHPYLSPLKVQASTKHPMPRGEELSARLPMKHYTLGFSLANTFPVSLMEILGNMPEIQQLLPLTTLGESPWESQS